MTDPDANPSHRSQSRFSSPPGVAPGCANSPSTCPSRCSPSGAGPILEHIVTGLKSAGITEILIVVGYRADVVTDHFGDGAGHGLKISYATQITQDGTGRVVELAKGFAGGDGFLLSYGDILIDPANYLVLASPGDEDGIVTVKHSDDVSKGGAVFVNERFDLIDLREKPKPGEPTSPWYNAGVYFFRPSIFEFTARLQKSVRGEYELTDAIRDLAQSGRRGARLRTFRRLGRRARSGNPRGVGPGDGCLCEAVHDLTHT